MKTKTVRVTDDWLPIPEEFLRELGWKEGDLVELKKEGDALKVRKTDAVETQNSKH